MKKNTYAILGLMFVIMSCTVNYNINYIKPPLDEASVEMHELTNTSVNYLLLRKYNGEPVKIPLSGLDLKDYISIYSLDSVEIKPYISSGVLTGCFFDLDHYRIILKFQPEYYIFNFYLIDNFSTTSLLSNNIQNTRIYHRDSIPAKLFVFQTDTLYLD